MKTTPQDQFILNATDGIAIPVNIVLPIYGVFHKIVMGDFPVSVLLSHFPSSNRVEFVHNGNCLNKEKSFSDQGIEANDSIIAVFTPSESNRWCNVTKDGTDFSKKIEMALNPRTTNESARIRDLHISKFEGKRRGLLKMIKTFNFSQSLTISTVPVPKPVLDYTVKLQASPLPVPW